MQTWCHQWLQCSAGESTRAELTNGGRENSGSRLHLVLIAKSIEHNGEGMTVRQAGVCVCKWAAHQQLELIRTVNYLHHSVREYMQWIYCDHYRDELAASFHCRALPLSLCFTCRFLRSATKWAQTDFWYTAVIQKSVPRLSKKESDKIWYNGRMGAYLETC